MIFILVKLYLVLQRLYLRVRLKFPPMKILHMDNCRQNKSKKFNEIWLVSTCYNLLKISPFISLFSFLIFPPFDLLTSCYYSIKIPEHTTQHNSQLFLSTSRPNLNPAAPLLISVFSWNFQLVLTCFLFLATLDIIQGKQFKRLW